MVMVVVVVVKNVAMNLMYGGCVDESKDESIQRNF